MAIPADEVPFTELIQQPTRTTGRLVGGRALRLRRRDAEDLVLMSAGRAQQEGEVVDLTARLLAGMLKQHGGPEFIRRVLPSVLPWTRFLPTDAIDELAREFVETTEAAASVNNMAPVAQLLAEWRRTAEVYADPELHAALTRAHEGDHGQVSAPGAVA
jgi:hypothetical protein